MSQGFDDNYYNPYANPTTHGYTQQRIPPVQSGTVTALAVFNFAYGALNLLCGAAITVLGAFLPQLLEQLEKQNGGGGNDAQQKQVMEQLGMFGGWFLIIAGVLSVLIGLPMIVAGFGLLKRQSWARIVTIVLGFVCGIVAALNLVQLQICGAIIPGAYCGVSLVILFNPQYAREFR